MRSSSVVVLSAIGHHILRWLRRHVRRLGWFVKRWDVRIMIQAGTRRLLFSARMRRSFFASGFFADIVLLPSHSLSRSLPASSWLLALLARDSDVAVRGHRLGQERPELLVRDAPRDSALL